MQKFMKEVVFWVLIPACIFLGGTSGATWVASNYQISDKQSLDCLNKVSADNKYWSALAQTLLYWSQELVTLPGSSK